jgi:hypothetical protein
MGKEAFLRVRTWPRSKLWAHLQHLDAAADLAGRRRVARRHLSSSRLVSSGVVLRRSYV